MARQLLPSRIHKTVTFYEVVTVRRGFCTTTTGSVRFPFFATAKRQFMYSMGFHVLPSLRFSISGGLSSGEWIAGFLAFPIFFIFFFPRWSGVKSFSYYYRVLRYVTWKSSMFFRSIDFHQNVTLIILFLIICNLYALGNIYYTIYINLIDSQNTIIVPFLSNYP